MKRTVFLAFSLACALALSGCGGGPGSGGDPLKMAAAAADGASSAEVSHTVRGETSEWAIEGDDFTALRSWLSGLEAERKTFAEGSTPGDGDGGESYTFTFSDPGETALSYVISGPEASYLLVGETWYAVSNPSDPFPEGPGGEELGDRIPMAMVGGVLYLDTGRESELDGRCGVMDGELTSQVDASEIPTQDGQTNFGAGYGYQYGTEEGTIEICIDGRWMVFKEETPD